jgi:hypothetical protein
MSSPLSALSARSLCFYLLGGKLASPQTQTALLAALDEMKTIPTNWCDLSSCGYSTDWKTSGAVAWIGLHDTTTEVNNALTGWQWDATDGGNGILDAGEPHCWSDQDGATTSKPWLNNWNVWLHGSTLSPALTSVNPYCDNYVWKPKKEDNSNHYYPYICQINLP